MIASAPWSLANSTSRPLKNSMRMLSRCASASASISWRSSSVNSDWVFWGLRITATMTWSKWRAERSMMSTWPRVTGSKEPGQRAVATLVSPKTMWASSEAEGGQRIPEGPLPAGLPLRGEDDGVPGRALDHDGRAVAQPSRFAEHLDQRGDCFVAGRIRRIDEHEAEGRVGGRRATEVAADVGIHDAHLHIEPEGIDVRAYRSERGPVA